MANMKKITEVTLADKVLENDTVLGERDGAAVRLPAGALGGSGGGWDAVIEWNNGSDWSTALPAFDALDRFGESTDLYSVLHPMLQAGEMPKILFHCIYGDDAYHGYYTPVSVVVDNYEETDDTICVFVLSNEMAGFTMRRIDIKPSGIVSCTNATVV